jgi:hypothetical protein
MPSEIARAPTMPEKLVQRGKELHVEVKDFANAVRFSVFVYVDVDGIAFPSS